MDSFYTLLKHREEVTHIVFVHGFDIALTDQTLRTQVSRMAREVAKELGKTLIEVETNLRSFSNTLVGWEKYHGAALASVALLFQHRFRKALIAATLTYAELIPWGSHPLLDPLWSTGLTEIEHDGCGATRVDKAAYISEYELPMDWLRVCYKNPDSAYNCGRCEKCLRTMITLRIVGAQARCKTLPSDLDLEQVANMRIPDNLVVPRQNLNALERLGTDPELARSLSEALKRQGSRDTRNERAESRRLQRQLSLAQKKLARIQGKLKASRRNAQISRAKSESLAEYNRLLTARYSQRRYKLADTLAGFALRIQGIVKSMRRKSNAD